MNVPLRLAVILIGLTWWSAVSWAECEDLKIEEASGIAFGQIAVPERGGGVVVVSPNGGVATLGDVGSSGGAEPGFIRICGPAGAEFVLVFDTDELNLADDQSAQKPHVVRNLEAVARGAQLHPSGPGEWTGTFGLRGKATIAVGGTLTIPSRKTPASFAANFRIAIMPAY
ncbi:MAG: DUF4402 domain-containing protein [Hyphomicrobiales bacterium]